MPYNERLAERIRALLAKHPGITERKMFGGIAFMIDGKMCVGIVGDDLMVRTGAERYADALARPNARPMDFTGRVSRGMVYVSPAGVTRGPALERWIDMGLAAAAEATPSRRRRPQSIRRSARKP